MLLFSFSSVVIILLASLLLCDGTYGACMERQTITTELFFRCQLNVEDFSFSSSLVGEGDVSYTVYEAGYPGRPDWINSLTVQGGESLVLYGVPAITDLGDVSLRVIAQRSDFETSTKDIVLTVEPLQGRIVIVLDFIITNVDRLELLTAGNFSDLQVTLGGVFTNQEPFITAVLERNSPDPRKEGVTVQVTPGLNITTPSRTTTQVEANLVQGNCTTPNLLLPPLNFNIFHLRGYVIDWCMYAMKVYEDVTMSSETTPTLRVAPPTTGRSYITLVVIIVVVGVVLIMALSGLSCVFFGGQKQAKTQSEVILLGTRSTTQGMQKAQLVLRRLSYKPPDKEGVALEEAHPQSSESDCLEYDEPLEEPSTFHLQAPPPYRHDHQLLNRTPTPTI